jgi:hypothetical protein
MIYNVFNLIQYKKVVVPEKEQNAHAPNAATWHKWGYLLTKIYVTELRNKATKPF